MDGLINSIIASAVAGIGGTCLGAIIASVTYLIIGKKNNESAMNSFIRNLMGFSGGIMLVVICFELIPSSYEYADFFSSMAAVVFGCIIVPVFDVLFYSLNETKAKLKIHPSKQNRYAKVSVIVFFSIALHNFPEGLAVGSGFGASIEYGAAIAMVIAFHNIPEGIALAVPMIASNKSTMLILLAAFLSGISTVLGASLGWIAAGISTKFIGICLGFAGGAMLYVVIGQLFPISYEKKKSNGVIIFILIGFIIGLMITK